MLFGWCIGGHASSFMEVVAWFSIPMLTIDLL